MAEEIIRVLKVDTQNSGKSINDLRKDIKSLRQELEKTTVGTEEFESTLKQLTQAQKSYNEVQQQIRDMSRTNQQEMVKFATFAQNLAKSYSALNAAVGLFSSGNEDVQKAMLKVQRTIQLIQGLEGIAGLVRDIPKIAASFKNWFNALDPVEKQVDRIAKGINGIDPKKLAAINEYNRNAGKTPTVTTTTTGSVGGGAQQIIAQNQELAKQTRTYYPALLQQQKDLYKARENALKQLNDTKESIAEIKEFAADYMKAIVIAGTKAGASAQKLAGLSSELANGKQSAAGVIAEIQKLPGVNAEVLKQLDAMGYDLDYLTKNGQTLVSTFAEQQKRLPELEAQYSNLDTQYEKISSDIQDAEMGMSKFQKALAKTGVIGRTAMTMIKTAILSIGIGLLIEGIIELVKWVGEAVSKSMEWVKINNEIAKSTNQIASKGIVVLKELAIAYARVGDTAAEKQKFLETYKDKIKETGLAIDTVNEADEVFINNTNKYVAAIMARAKAQATENKAIELYQQYLDERYKLEEDNLKWWQKGLVAMATPEGQEKVIDDFIKKNREKNQAAIDKLDKDIEERLKKMFDSVAEFEKEYVDIFAELESTTTTKTDPDKTDWDAEYKKSLEALIKYTKERLGILEDARTKELESAKASYEDGLKLIEENYQNGLKAAKGNAERIAAVEKAKADALKTLEITYEREIQDILKKYRDQALEDAKAEGRKQIDELQKQIEQIRRMNDTSNLREPRQQNVETQYNQSAITTMLGLGAGWTNTYQSAEDIKAQYDAQVKYNNDVYMLTYQRITQENELLNQQLQNEQLTADERFNIERTLVENQIALDDALNENYEANNEAFISMQQKRQQALNATLQVGSNLFGAMATMAKTESQNQKKTEKERQNALVAYKAFAVSQAIINTFQGANEAYTSMASIPYVGPALGIAAAVAAVAMGIANVHSILSESTNTSSATSAATTSAPQAMQTPPIEYTRQLIGDSELDEVNQPIRCYVLESDITTTQNKVAVTESNASF